MTPHRQTSVSLCMIVRDEAHQLRHCLEPVASLFDEIVVVDTGSHDQTKTIAAQFTPHVFDFAWCDDFSAARNEALRRSHGEWIFWLDADDRITAENGARLHQLLASLDGIPRAYLMDTVCSTQFACEGFSLITHPRLFRRHAGLCWHGRVHEQLRPAVSELGYDLVWSEVQIHHVGYQDLALQQRKLQRDIRLLRMDYAVDPDDASTLVHLGLAYYHLGRFELARECLHRLIRLSHVPADHLRQVYGALAVMAQREGKLDEALATLDRGLALFPDGEFLLYLRAECLYELDRYGEAKDALSRILNHPRTHQYRGGVPGDIQDKLAPRKLADVLRLERNFGAAESLLRATLARFPDDTISWHTLGRVYLDSQQRDQLLAVAERLRSCPQGDIFSLLLLATWHLSQRELGSAGQLIDQLISLAPQMPLPRILRAEWLAQIGAPVTERIAACRDILRLQPGHLDARRVLQSLEAAAAAQPAAHTPGDFCTSVVLGVDIAAGAGAA